MNNSENRANLLVQLESHKVAESVNSRGYNWDDLASLIKNWEPDALAKSLLLIHFELTNYYINDSGACGGSSELSNALCGLRQLYEAIDNMVQPDKGTLKFASVYNNTTNE